MKVSAGTVVSSGVGASLPSSLVLGRIQFLVVVRQICMCFLLSGRGHSQLREATLRSGPHGPSNQNMAPYFFTTSRRRMSIGASCLFYGLP